MKWLGSLRNQNGFDLKAASFHAPPPSSLASSSRGPHPRRALAVAEDGAASNSDSNRWPSGVSPFLLALGIACAPDCLTRAASAELGLDRIQGQTILKVLSTKQQDCSFETSSNLTHWVSVPTWGSLMSGDLASAPSKAVALDSSPLRFWRVKRSEGLYDNDVFHTFHLTFSQANWQSLLTTARSTGGNVSGDLALDNGIVLTNVGARYKGNTSFTMGGNKKSINIETDYGNPDASLMGYSTLNLNNAAADETIMREAVYFSVMQPYTVSPKASLARLFINGADWGVYSLAQNGDSDLIREWFPSTKGDRWRAPNAAGTTGGTPGAQVPPVGGGRPPGGGGTGAGGMFSSPLSALSWLGTNIATYKANYELKVQNSTNAWEILVHAIDVLNNSALTELRDKAEDVLAVDRWLWFTAIENIFTDDDSYWNKGADYAFYYEPESGRIHPIEHDGNEAFTVGDVSLSPVTGASGTNRPVLYRFLAVNELRQRYLAHMRTVLEESFHPDVITPLISRFQAMSVAAITADPIKSYTMLTYSNDLASLKTFVTNRYRFLTNHAELLPLAPSILALTSPSNVVAGTPPVILSSVQSAPQQGIDSVWLYFRAGNVGRFTQRQMFDDGAHADGAANDGVYGAVADDFPSDTKVHYYVEARSSNTAQAASFFPPRAEQVTQNYTVRPPVARETSVIINELMANNSRTIANPQGEYADWIELRNLASNEVDLTGKYLTDDLKDPRQWQFPAGTKIPANGYLLIWADSDSQATTGLHASFKLDADGEQVFLLDTDQKLTAILSSVVFASLGPDVAYGRSSTDLAEWKAIAPSPGRANP